MTDNAALVAAFQALATTVAGINPPALPVAAPPPPAAAAPLLDPFTDDQPFDISTHTESSAFTTASSHLDITCDGTSNQFLSFMIAHCLCATEICWNVAPPHGMLKINRARSPYFLQHCIIVQR